MIRRFCRGELWFGCGSGLKVILSRRDFVSELGLEAVYATVGGLHSVAVHGKVSSSIGNAFLSIA